MVPLRSQSGFSLVELSIVLVILGLLTGGILGGQALIRAAELRAVPTEYARWVSATQTFRDKYFALPGDLTNATSFWGLAGGDGRNAACNNAVTNSTATCNGNGNGLIATTGANENTLFWQHQSNAGLIEWKPIKASTCCEVNQSLPASRLSQGSWFIGGFSAPVSGSANAFDGVYAPNAFSFSHRPNNSTVQGVLAPEEAWNIDIKMDDGIIHSGRYVANWSAVFSRSGVACSTAASAADFNATYNLSNQSKDCIFWFRQIF
ncbi:prepilin-type N-terminal cleavage/methylation domain-containing protein [Sphingomonas sp. 35-24ZXX]|uniref:prepilin-type N-terminal cleavage/methylation domain-containing protein n=1 Tax=Sphingomonas sp. 35-24ZXX TaxID=1545915 RepID=UPI0018CE3FB4|nr:prepilin-type N-terminal cleavage/methylation domain-containing protein [Sphingomonas sp. 35-24ZXX]